MSHYLITGGAGYIGSVLVKRLLAENCRVTVIDRFYFGKESLPVHPKLSCILQDSREISIEQLRGVNIVIDLAAMSNDPCGEMFETLTWETNHLARARTAKLAKMAGVSRYILPSSCSVYGFQEGKVDETSATNPLTTYAISNLRAEQDILSLSSSDFCVTALRLATVFGLSPRMRLDLVVNAMAYSAWKHGEIIVHGGGSQRRPLVHVKDVTSALCHFCKADTSKINGEIFNIGSEKLNFQIIDIAQNIRHILAEKKRDAKILNSGPQDSRSYDVSFAKAKEKIGWTSSQSMKREIQNIILALDKGRVEIDERCYTLNWYNKLLENTWLLTNRQSVQDG